MKEIFPYRDRVNQLALAFLKLNFTAVGGLAALVAMMRQMSVVRRE